MTCYDFSENGESYPSCRLRMGGYIRIVKMYVGCIVDLGMFPQ